MNDKFYIGRVQNILKKNAAVCYIKCNEIDYKKFHFYY